MDILEKKFNLISLPEIVNPVLNAEIQVANDSIKDSVVTDFENSRKNITDIINIGAGAIDKLGELAFTSQDPDHYVALSSLIKSVSEATSTLLKLHTQVEQIKQKPLNFKNEEHNHIHLTATTSEIAKLLKGEKL